MMNTQALVYSNSARGGRELGFVKRDLIGKTKESDQTQDQIKKGVSPAVVPRACHTCTKLQESPLQKPNVKLEL